MNLLIASTTPPHTTPAYSHTHTPHPHSTPTPTPTHTHTHGHVPHRNADGILTSLFKDSEAACEVPPVCQGWNAAGGGEEAIVFDFGSCVTIDGLALYAAGDNAHDPRTMWLETADSASSLVAGNGTRVASFSGERGVATRQEFAFAPHSARYWRWVTSCRWSNIPCPGYQTYVKPPPPPPPPPPPTD
jgi:hypothetical protein